MRSTRLVLVCLLLAVWGGASLAGCAAGRVHDSVRLEDGTALRRGMSAAELRAALGPPDTETLGPRESRYAQRFCLQSLRMRGVTEMAWVDRDPLIVAWLDRGRVLRLGTLSRARAFEPYHDDPSVRNNFDPGAEPLPTDWLTLPPGADPRASERYGPRRR